MISKQLAPPFVVITPAHNEESFIELTIRSMINQTVRPLRWILVDDCSTDRTLEIARSYSSDYAFMEVVSVHRSGERHFGNKVRAFNRGLLLAEKLDYDYIGNLDADITIEETYYEHILSKFSSDQKLGLSGGMVYSKIGDSFISQEVAPDSVAGAVQLFRRECFEGFGGYLELPHGGIDSAAEIMARMQGWKVRSFTDVHALEHRRTGTANADPLAAKVREGQLHYALGYGFLFMLLRSLYRMKERPLFVGGAATLVGYLRSMIHRAPLVLPPSVVKYLRLEQRRKILSKFLPVDYFHSMK